MLTLGQRMLLIALVGVVPMLGVIGYNELSARAARHEEVTDLALSTARQAALEMERLIDGARNVLKAVAAAPTVRAFDAGQCGPYLVDLKSRLPELAAIAVYDTDGVSRCRSDMLPVTGNFADRRYFQDALASPGELVVGVYTISRVSGRPTLPLAIGIADNNGKVIAVTAAGLDLEWLGRSLRERPLTKNASLTVADRNGVIIAREPFPERFVGESIPNAHLPLVAALQPGTQEITSQDGARRVLGYIPAAAVATPVSGLSIGAGISVDEAFRAINRGTLRAAGVAVAAAAASIGIAIFLSRRLIEGPVRRIQRVLALRRRGREMVRTKLRPEDGEIEQLGAELDRFMDELSAANRERDVAEERRRLMMQEMSHRLKNMIATIQSLARQSLRDRAEPQALEAFNHRLCILAQAHHLLLQDEIPKASLKATISAALGSFADPDGQRIRLEGIDLLLKSSAVQGLSMALHELCTNATKYGALSVDGGKIDIDWHVCDGRFALTWRESGGPPVEKPVASGFGSRMIEKLLAIELGGTVSVSYPESGVVCRVDAPSDAVVAKEAVR